MRTDLFESWIERRRGRRVVRALGEEFDFALPMPVTRLTRVWLGFEELGFEVGFGLDHERDALRLDQADPVQAEFDGVLCTAPRDLSRRAAYRAVADRALVDGELLVLAGGTLPSAVRFDFEGEAALFLVVWGDALELWGRREVDDLERQGFGLSPFGD